MRKISHWLECYTAAESIDIYRDLALTHALRSGCKQGEEIARLIRRERFRELCEFDLQLEGDGITAYSLSQCRQALALFSKLPFLDIGIDKEKAAWDKFVDAERVCGDINTIFRSRARGDFQFLPRVESWLFKAQRQIAAILGPVPTWESLGYRFGGGATTLTKKRDASIREKFRVGVACSEELLPAAHAVLGELPLLTKAWSTAYMEDQCEMWAQVPVQIMDGRLEFVPKNAKTFRSVVTEPPLNGLVQLAIGDYLFGRLSRVGVDLRDQTRNQRLALEGSLTGALATLDLSSASDTISKELVYDLLPLDWAAFLGLSRTGHVVYKGQRITLEKFSSMGNGYTFPLESLIFYALARAVCEKGEVVSVFGDDIICPTHRYADLAHLLHVVGFTVNEQKSFSNGPFRESCGKDYYRGIDIRPYYADELVSNRALFTLHNFYVRNLDMEMASSVLRLIHPDLCLWGPDGYGDGHLIGDHPRKRKNRHLRSGWAGYVFDTYSQRPRRDERCELPGDFVLPSYSVYRRGAEEIVRADIVAKLSTLLPRGNGSQPMGTLPIPELTTPDGSVVKAVSLPLSDSDAYRRVSIYTLNL